MAIKTQEEILNEVKGFLGENADESALNFLEDITDTLADLHTRAQDNTDWEKKYQDLDNSWKQRYRDRFFEAVDDNPEEDIPPEFSQSPMPKQLKFEDLFKEA